MNDTDLALACERTREESRVPDLFSILERQPKDTCQLWRRFIFVLESRVMSNDTKTIIMKSIFVPPYHWWHNKKRHHKSPVAFAAGKPFAWPRNGRLSLKKTNKTSRGRDRHDSCFKARTAGLSSSFATFVSTTIDGRPPGEATICYDTSKKCK